MLYLLIHSPNIVSLHFVKFLEKWGDIFWHSVYLYNGIQKGSTFLYTQKGIWSPSNFLKHIFRSEEKHFLPTVYKLKFFKVLPILRPIQEFLIF